MNSFESGDILSMDAAAIAFIGATKICVLLEAVFLGFYFWRRSISNVWIQMWFGRNHVSPSQLRFVFCSTKATLLVPTWSLWPSLAPAVCNQSWFSSPFVTVSFARVMWRQQTFDGSLEVAIFSLKYAVAWMRKLLFPREFRPTVDKNKTS